MTVKDDWLDGDTFAAADENDHATQTNTNTTDIAARVVGEASSADSEVALFSGTGGKTIKRATGSGIAKLTSGVLSTASAGTDYVAPGGALGTPSSGTLTNATGLPISGLVASTSTALGVGSVELGHASDTTIARSGSGDITVEGNAVYRAGGTDVPVTDGGTGRSTSTTAYGLIAAGTTATGAHQTLAAGATTEILVGGGASALPVWTTAQGSGAPVRATSPTLTTPNIGTPSAGVLTNCTGLPVAGGGTGAATLTGIVKGNGTSAFTAASAGTDYYAPGSTDVAVADGGTGVSTLTGIVKGNGTSAFTAATAGTDYTTPSSTETQTNKTLTNPTVNNYTEGVVAIGNSSTSKTIDLTSGTVQTCTLTGNCTFTMPTATAGKSFVLLLKTGAGSFTGTFTSVKWPTAGAPTITTAASKMDILTFVADGSVWYGSYVQGYTP